MIRSPIRSPLSLAVRSAFGRSRGGAAPVPAFDPATLFGVNDRGGIYDATDADNMFQLSGGTGAVATGDPVGYLADLGPIGRPALQATASMRPVFGGAPRTLGTELVTNGRFATDTAWTKGTGWTINTTTGRAEKTAGTASVLSIPISVTPGRFYFLPFYITRTAGTVTARLTGGTTVSGTARNYGGSYVEIFYALTGNVALEFSADATFAGSVGNVSMKEVTGFVNRGVRFDGTDDFLGTASVDLSNSTTATILASFQMGQSAAFQVVAEFGNYNGSVTGSGEMVNNNGWATRFRGATGSGVVTAPFAENTVAANYQNNILISEFDSGGATIADQAGIEVRGVKPTNTASGALGGGGNMANGAITLGKAFTSLGRLNGIIHRVLVINRKLTTQEKADAISWAGAGMVISAVLGDSTVAYLNSSVGIPQAMRVSSLVGGMVANGADVSKAGDRIANQKTAWTGIADKSALQAVVIQIGLNDVKGRVGENLATTAQVIADLQDLVDTVNADKPAGCRVYVSGLTPCKAWLDTATNPAAAYAAWQAVNEAIAGGGSTPITGVDGRITSHVAALAGSGDILHPNYDMDGVHENNEARFIIAQAWRARLEADGLL